MGAILDIVERKKAWLKAEQAMGFLMDCPVEKIEYDQGDDTHALFQARAQAQHLMRLLEEPCTLHGRIWIDEDNREGYCYPTKRHDCPECHLAIWDEVFPEEKS